MSRMIIRFGPIARGASRVRGTGPVSVNNRVT
jgi:hypothetical protein